MAADETDERVEEALPGKGCRPLGGRIPLGAQEGEMQVGLGAENAGGCG